MAITNVSQTSTFGGIGLGPNADGVYVIGGTKDTLYGGDMTNDRAGDGIALTGGSSSDSHFALAVYGDDGGTAVASGWVSTGFFSYVNYAVQAAGSAMALMGQVQLKNDFTAGDNIVGTAGLVYADSNLESAALAVSAHCFGGQFSVTFSSGTFAAGYRLAAASLTCNTNGATTNGTVTGLHFMNATSGGMDAAMSFGTVAGDITGSGCDLTAAAGDQDLGHILVYLGSTLGYINVFSDGS